MPSYAGAFCRGNGPLGKIIDQTSPDLYRAAHSFVMSKIKCQFEGEVVNQDKLFTFSYVVYLLGFN